MCVLGSDVGRLCPSSSVCRGFWAASHPSGFGESEPTSQMKVWPAVCGPQDKAYQQSKTCGFQTVIGAHSLGKSYQLQSHEAEDIYLNAGFTQSWIPPVNTVLHGGQIGNLWDHSRGMWGLERHGTIHCVTSFQHTIICLQVLSQGQVRNMTPQQVVRQIPPLTALPQGVPGTVSSAILFSAPGVTAANLPRPGIVQVNAFLLSIKKLFQSQKWILYTDSVDVNSDMNDNLWLGASKCCWYRWMLIFRAPLLFVCWSCPRCI